MHVFILPGSLKLKRSSGEHQGDIERYISLVEFPFCGLRSAFRKDFPTVGSGLWLCTQSLFCCYQWRFISFFSPLWRFLSLWHWLCQRFPCASLSGTSSPDGFRQGMSANPEGSDRFTVEYILPARHHLEPFVVEKLFDGFLVTDLRLY